MTTFVTAYLIVWLAMLLYVIRIGARQRRLLETVESLQRRIEQQERDGPTAAKAA